MFAITLSRRDFREHDQVVSLYTEEKGKVELLARGVKKIVSKNAAHLEPFSFVSIGIAYGKEIDYLTSVQSVNFFANIRRDMVKSVSAGRVMSLVDRLTQVGHPDSRIFELLKTWLVFVNDTTMRQHSNATIIDAFVVKLFNLLGFSPILDRCVVCEKTKHSILKEDIESGGSSAGLYFAGGGLVCHACSRDKRGAGEEVMACGLKEVSDMDLLLQGSWKVIAEFDLSKDERQRVHQLIYEYGLYHSEKKLNDWDNLV